MIELVLGLLKGAFDLAVEVAGEQAARAACDDACKIRQARDEADARAAAKFGPPVGVAKSEPPEEP